MFAEAGTAYNPIPSPNGTMIAFVRTGWDRPGGVGGFGRSNLRSDIFVMDADGKVTKPDPLADTFLVGWTSDGKNIVCFRDYICFLVSPDGRRSKQQTMPWYSELYKRMSTERSTYCAFLDAMCWVRYTDCCNYIETNGRRSARNTSSVGDILIPSPNGEYVAAVSHGEGPLWVFDTRKDSWANLGKVTVHPDPEWDYIKPSWNPWFRDSSRLVFISNGDLVISSPDGRDQLRVAHVRGPAGLPVPSPDGSRIAFVSFEPTPMKIRPDLPFWGGTTIWVVAAHRGAKPRGVSQKAVETTYDLNWLNNRELVFDRIGTEVFYRDAHIWKARVPAP